MKKNSWALPLLYSGLSLCFSQIVSAQNNYLSDIDQQQTAVVDFKESKGSFFLTGTRVNTLKPTDTQANLFAPGWLKGIVQFKNGQQQQIAQLNFNVVSNQVYFNNNGKLNRFAEPVVGFTLWDTLNKRSEVIRFNNGYPRFGMQTPATFYQVMAYGKKLQLLKYVRSYVVQRQDYSMMTTFTSKLITEYYLFNINKKSLKLLKGSMSSLEKILPHIYIRHSLFANPKHLTEQEMIGVINDVNNL